MASLAVTIKGHDVHYWERERGNCQWVIHYEQKQKITQTFEMPERTSCCGE